MHETEVIIKNIGAFSYLGVFVIAIMANVVVPFPEEIVILGLGYAIGTGHINALISFPIIIAGLLISDTVMYWLAKKGTKVLTAFYERFFAKTVSFKQEWIDHHLGKVIFYSRFMMQFRFLGPFFAGQKKMPYREFLKYEMAALVVYVGVLLWVGAYFQNRFESIISGIGIVRNIILIAIGLLVLFAISKYIRRKIIGFRSE